MDRKRISIELSGRLLEKIDELKGEWALRSRGAIVERLLFELFPADELEDGEVLAPSAEETSDSAVQLNLQKDANAYSGFDEGGSLMLVAQPTGELSLDFDLDPFKTDDEGLQNLSSRKTGIDLPLFVRKQSDHLKRSLDYKKQKLAAASGPMPMASGETLNRALEKAKNHWIDLYGHGANEAVVDAALLWLARDIWPQSDQSEGRTFTWSLASLVIESLATGWQEGDPNFERIMVMAGILEDPFSTSTLELRMPTLIRRFVNRFRRRKQGTSFQTLEHTMTLHGALKLLRLPTAPGHRLTLAQIRDAFREIAVQMHPDSGGSEEGMRKVNEAYQLLKELYRKD